MYSVLSLTAFVSQTRSLS